MEDNNTPDEDFINIELEDLSDDQSPDYQSPDYQSPDDQAAQQVPAATGRGNFPPVTSAASDEIVIDLDDLNDASLDAPVFPGGYVKSADASTAGKYAPVGPTAGQGYQSLKSKKSPVAAIFGNLMVQMLIAGLIGGLAAWISTEPWTHDDGQVSDFMTAMTETLLFTALIGAMVGAALGSVEGLLSGVFAKMAKGAGIGFLIGALGGAIAGVLGQLVYGFLTDRNDTFLYQVFARTVGWALIGMGIGLAQGVRYRNVRRLINGLVGGAVGGFAGGLLFDPISMFTGSGVISRLVGIVAIGAASGAAIGLLEEIRKEAWITIVEGPMTGKEFILYKPITAVGSASHSDIPLFKDPNVAPDHLRIQQVGNAFELVSLVGPEAVYINGAPAAHHRLRKGDLIHVGNTAFYYQDRALE